MLTTWAIICGGILFVFACAHFAWAYSFKKFCVEKKLAEFNTLTDEQLAGKVSILMSLRGVDPALKESLNSLLNQTHENYELIVVVDHKTDYAWQVVEQIKSDHEHGNRIKLFELSDPSDTCSLKCNSLVQGSRQIDEQSEYVIFVDADVVPHPDWVRDAISPLQDATVGVVTGNQWYSPNKSNPGSIMRSLWNAGSLVPSAVYGHPWAGSCAMRRADLELSLIHI